MTQITFPFKRFLSTFFGLMLLIGMSVCAHQDEPDSSAGGKHVCTPSSDTQGNPGIKAGSGYKILILMYHNLVTGFPTNEYDRKKSDFENDLKFIKSKNYQVISFEDLIKIRNGQMSLNSDAVILSFDDGYASWYTKAYPLLKKYDMPATFFIVPEWISSSNYLVWSQVWSMHDYLDTHGKNPYAIHSHTASHPFLKQWGIGKSQAVWQNFLDLQLGEAHDWIVDVTHQQELFLALPYGDGAGDSTIINTAINKGYAGIRTSERAAIPEDNINLYQLPSVAILSGTRIESMENYF
jgi:peptidoglycan/xylan/chitin deacetylase (PgdA/CDA1 family)